jgi:hypothetical protein
MARKPRHLDLRLLLAVAPFFAGCGPGPEERRCVDGEGLYQEDEGCDEAHPAYRPGAHWVFVPRRYYTGIGSHAGAFHGATTPGSGHAAVSRGGFGATGHAHAAGG